MNTQVEEACGKRFLYWYNEQFKGNYILQRAETYFPELKGGLRWEFVAYARDNPVKWIGIEIKELNPIREVSIWFEFWQDLCLELSQNLAAKGIQGKFEIIRPPPLHLKQKARRELKEAFIEVLIDKESILKEDEFADIGPDIADKFTNWPTQKSNLQEYRNYGEDRPSELPIRKSPNPKCEVRSLGGPIAVFDATEKHKEAFTEVFKLKKGSIRANRQLKLAKGKGAKETIWLLACSFVHKELIENLLQDLDSRLFSDIDYIYLVGRGNSDRVVKIYPN